VNPPTWSLITVAYNSAITLTEHWAPVRPADVEWIVVDNASQDGSVQTAAELGATVIPLKANVGFSAANNVALARARGRYVAFVNPDVVVQYDDLAALAESIETLGGLVAPQLVNRDGSAQANGRGAPLLISKIANRIFGGEAGTNDYLLKAAMGESRYAFWLTGAVIAGRRVDFEALGGWDESYFLYYEDVDLSMRAWKSGLTVAVMGGLRWRHTWARENASRSWRAQGRELRAAATFYRRLPGLIFGGPADRRKHARQYELSGRLVEAAASVGEFTN
jgi:N-acetylglucosaminyl-diphospho-decaprenol L-rhamnosyltransferase